MTDPMGLQPGSFATDTLCFAQELEERQRLMQCLPTYIFNQTLPIFSALELALDFVLPISEAKGIYAGFQEGDYVKVSINFSLFLVQTINPFKFLRSLKHNLEPVAYGLYRPGARKMTDLIVPERSKAMLRAAHEHAIKAGLDMSGIKMKIVKDKETKMSPFYGRTVSRKAIELYPKAFTSSEELVRTLAHERAHVWDLQRHGVDEFTDTFAVGYSERLAQRYEEYVWNIVKELFGYKKR
jgi:hypothetical protein